MSCVILGMHNNRRIVETCLSSLSSDLCIHDNNHHSSVIHPRLTNNQVSGWWHSFLVWNIVKPMLLNSLFQSELYSHISIVYNDFVTHCNPQVSSENEWACTKRPLQIYSHSSSTPHPAVLHKVPGGRSSMPLSLRQILFISVENCTLPVSWIKAMSWSSCPPGIRKKIFRLIGSLLACKIASQ